MEQPSLYFPKVKGILPTKELVSFAKIIYEVSYKKTSNDTEALNLMYDYFDELSEKDPAGGDLYQVALNIPDEQLVMMWAARWADQGFPRLLIEPKFAALLMATDITEEAMELIVPPWQAFLIEIPEPILQIYCGRSQCDVPIVRILVQYMERVSGEKVWNYIAQGSSGVQIWRHGVTTEQMIHVERKYLDTWEKEMEGYFVPVDKKDERAMALIGKLILSVCLSMSDPQNFHEQKKNKGRGEKVRGKYSAEIKTYVVGRPIKIDCRETIKNWISGKKKGSSPKVQFLVRGHWKRIAYGPGGSLRKVGHIEPYWKGTGEVGIMREVVLKNNSLKRDL